MREHAMQNRITAVDAPAGRPALAFSTQLSRNLIVQGFVIAMVAITGLTATAWPYVLAWSAAAAAIAVAEDRALRIAPRETEGAAAARLAAPALRIAGVVLEALAALVLIRHGDAAAKLFAFALMAFSMVYVLMRYYRSPAIFLGGVAPHMAILGIVAFSMARRHLAHGQVMEALTTTFVIAIFALLFWSARAQLATAWDELRRARDEAEDREYAAAAANRAKSQFLTTMSHELRTPLNGVLGMAQALSNDSLTELQRERVKIIRRSGESLLAVLNDLLDLSKIEASALELELVEFDLEHVVRGVVAAFRGEAHKKGLTFDFTVDDAAVGQYLGDQARIKRILYNLSSNAVKFTQQGRITLAITQEAGVVVFKVADTGVGIAAHDLDRLFDDFFQVDATLCRRHGGAGLGLSIARELTRLMDGAMTVESTVGEGSTFTLRLPLQPVASTPKAAEPKATADGETAQLRILAAEDNETNRLVLKTLLAQAGVAPVFAVNGADAVDAWERQAWDVILMDIQMPEMDGVTATRAIRQREAVTGRMRTPIIAVTANAMTHQLAEYAAAGMDGVVSKPLDVSRLFATLEQVLDCADQATANNPAASAA
jgi:signal transduction histidine kinase/ActR/RegA family two-component response regulator